MRYYNDETLNLSDILEQISIHNNFHDNYSDQIIQ